MREAKTPMSRPQLRQQQCPNRCRPRRRSHHSRSPRRSRARSRRLRSRTRSTAQHSPVHWRVIEPTGLRIISRVQQGWAQRRGSLRSSLASPGFPGRPSPAARSPRSAAAAGSAVPGSAAAGSASTWPARHVRQGSWSHRRDSHAAAVRLVRAQHLPGRAAAAVVRAAGPAHPPPEPPAGSAPAHPARAPPPARGAPAAPAAPGSAGLRPAAWPAAEPIVEAVRWSGQINQQNPYSQQPHLGQQNARPQQPAPQAECLSSRAGTQIRTVGPEYRWFDGNSWTGYVATGGVQRHE